MAAHTKQRDEAATLTQEQLELAFRQLRDPPTWPATLEAALQVQRCRVAIHGLARNLRRGGRHQAAPRPTGLPTGGWPPVPPTPPSSSEPLEVARRASSSLATGATTPLGSWAQQRSGKAQWIDRKRAAANDRDEE